MKINVNLNGNLSLGDILVSRLDQISQGAVSLIIQDSRILQINVEENFDFDGECVSAGKKQPKGFEYGNLGDKEKLALARRIIAEARSIKYGSLTIHLKQGKILLYEKNQRLKELKG